LTFLIIIVYIIAFSIFTIYIPQAKRSIVIGFICKPNAMTVFGDRCPFLDLGDLAGVSYDEFELWTRASIALVRAGLVSLWFLFFICLSALIGQFLVYQMRRRVGES
jgi:hypothetical protein